MSVLNMIVVVQFVRYPCICDVGIFSVFFLRNFIIFHSITGFLFFFFFFTQISWDHHFPFQKHNDFTPVYFNSAHLSTLYPWESLTTAHSFVSPVF